MPRLRKKRAADLPVLPAEEFEKEFARRSLLRFTTHTMPGYQINWHHEIICRELDALVRGDVARLILTMPPRHGKSELVSRRLPAYILGREPDAEVIACSYSADLAQRMNRDVQRIIDDPKYTELFPGTRLSGSGIRAAAHGSYLRNSDIFEIVGRAGSYRAAGVGGGITGMGAKYAIIDDPIKNFQEANSETSRNAIWEWYTSTLYTRLAPDGRVLIILTRWHEDDIVGRLIERQGDEYGDQWRVISFPALAEENREDRHPEDKRAEGDALWKERFDIDRLTKIKAAIGSHHWSGLYQQRPSPAEGAIFLRHWWRQYNENPQQLGGDMEEIVMSWDLSFKDTKTSDYVVGQVWGKRKADRYLLDQIRARMDFPATLAAVQALKSKWPQAKRIYVEDKANGPAVIAALQREIQGLIAVNPEGGKVARAHAVTAQIEAGNVYLPSFTWASWVGDFIEECSAFPHGANDDQVDATTQALNKLSADKGQARWVRRPSWA